MHLIIFENEILWGADVVLHMREATGREGCITSYSAWIYLSVYWFCII